MTGQRPRLGHMVVQVGDPLPRGPLQLTGKVTGTSTTGRVYVHWEGGDGGWVDAAMLLAVGHEGDAEWEGWDE